MLLEFYEKHKKKKRIRLKIKNESSLQIMKKKIDEHQRYVVVAAAGVNCY